MSTAGKHNKMLSDACLNAHLLQRLDDLGHIRELRTAVHQVYCCNKKVKDCFISTVFAKMKHTQLDVYCFPALNSLHRALQQAHLRVVGIVWKNDFNAPEHICRHQQQGLLP